MKKLRLYKFTLSPGYGDMRGARYFEEMKRNEAGEWIITSSSREYYSAPTKVTTYSVTEEQADAFEKFIKDKRIPSLERRLKSKLFITDYHPWSISISFREEDGNYSSEKYYSFGEYKLYTPTDRKKIATLKKMFEDMHSTIIEVIETKKEI